METDEIMSNIISALKKIELEHRVESDFAQLYEVYVCVSFKSLVM